MQSSTWQLLRDDRVVADLVVYGGDFPWLNAQVFPKEGFEEIRPIFEEELRLVDDDENIQSWEDAYHRVRAEVSLAAPRRPSRSRVPPPHRRQRSVVAVE